MARRVVAVLGVTALLATVPTASAQALLRKIGELRLSVLGISVTVDLLEPVVPKNTESAVRIVVRAGGEELTAAEVEHFLGSAFAVEGELSGPGLAYPVALPVDGEALDDPLLLPLPALTRAGDYTLSNLRIVSAGGPVLDVSPSNLTLKVIDQILVTSVTTRPLSLDEIRDKGIVLDSDDYLGFEFALGVKLESDVVELKFPVVFDRDGVSVPLPELTAPKDPERTGPVRPETLGLERQVTPVLLGIKLPGGGKQMDITMPDGKPIRIPSLLVIPGNVGYLKQFFSALRAVAKRDFSTVSGLACKANC
jgi:hypothetical protein